MLLQGLNPTVTVTCPALAALTGIVDLATDGIFSGPLCRWKLNGRPTFDFQDMQRNKRRELERLSDTYRQNLEKADVDFIEGRGMLVDKNTIEVNGQQYRVSLVS